MKPETRAGSARTRFRPALRTCGRVTFVNRDKSNQKRSLQAGGGFGWLSAPTAGARLPPCLGSCLTAWGWVAVAPTERNRTVRCLNAVRSRIRSSGSAPRLRDLDGLRRCRIVAGGFARSGRRGPSCSGQYLVFCRRPLRRPTGPGRSLTSTSSTKPEASLLPESAFF